MLHLAAAGGDGQWEPLVVRTTATEGIGVAALAETIERFRARMESSGARRARAVEHWQQRLVVLLQEHLLERTLGGEDGKRELSALAGEVAERRKSPYDAVRELAARLSQ